MIPFSDLKNGLYLQGSSVAGRPGAWRHFAEVPGLQVPQLFISESRIVLGPTVESAANVQFVLKRLLLERQLYGTQGNAVDHFLQAVRSLAGREPDDGNSGSAGRR